MNINKRITVRSAIDNSGGYQDYADKRKVYVIKANGLIEKANRNIFTRNVKLEPGDTIVVPRKIITNNPGIDALLPVTKFFQILHFLLLQLKVSLIPIRNLEVRNYLLIFSIFIFTSEDLYSDSFKYNSFNNHGVIGLINMPSARFYDEALMELLFMMVLQIKR